MCTAFVLLAKVVGRQVLLVLILVYASIAALVLSCESTTCSRKRRVVSSTSESNSE
jgi:hypothetical protein